MKLARIFFSISLLTYMAVLAIPAKTYAAAFTPLTVGQSVWSIIFGLGGEAAGIGVAVSGSTTAGPLITAGSGIVTIFDPPLATFYNGQISLDFDANSLEVTNYGWLGDWGLDSSLLAPPVTNGLYIPEGTSFVLQSPNPLLSTSIFLDNTNGNITAYYDWGSLGYQSPSDVKHFNFFSVIFITKADLNGLSDFDSKVNFSAFGNFNNCIPPGSNQVQLCGQPVPEPSTILGLITGLGFGITFKCKQAKVKLTTKNFKA